MRKPDRRPPTTKSRPHPQTVSPMWEILASQWHVTPEQAFARMHGRETVHSHDRKAA